MPNLVTGHLPELPAIRVSPSAQGASTTSNREVEPSVWHFAPSPASISLPPNNRRAVVKALRYDEERPTFAEMPDTFPILCTAEWPSDFIKQDPNPNTCAPSVKSASRPGT